MAGKSLIGALRVTLGLDSAEFTKGAAKAKQEMGLLQKGAGFLKGALVGVIGIDTINQFRQAGRASLDLAGGLGEVAAQLGVSAKALQTYRFIATQTGVEQDQMDQALSQLTRRLGDAANGAKEPAKAFESLGIKIHDANGRLRQAEDIIPEIADGMVRINDPAKQAAVAVDLFGKSGQKLMPLLQEGSANLKAFASEAQRLGIVLSDEAIAKADELADQLAKQDKIIEMRRAALFTENGEAVAQTEMLWQNAQIGFFKAVAGINNFFSAWTDGAARLQAQVEAFDARIAGALSSAWQKFEGLHARMQESGWATIRFFAAMPGRVIASVRAMVDGIGEWLGTRMTAIFEGLKKQVDRATGFFHTMWDKVVGHSYVPDMVDAIGAHMKRLDAEMVAPVGKSTQDATEKFRAMQQEVSSILDRLFPENAARNRFDAELATLNAYFDTLIKRGGNALALEKERAAAVTALQRAYLGLNRDGPGGIGFDAGAIERTTGGKSIEEMSEEIADKAGAALDMTKKRADAMRVQVVGSFSQMVDGSLRELNRFANGIKSGNWLDIVGGLLNAIDGIAAALTGGKGTSIGPFTFGNGSARGGLPGFATGGAMRIKGVSGVDRNLLSLNGRPLARVSSGEVLNVTPANEVGRGGVNGQLTVRLEKDGSLSAFMAGIAGRVVDDRTPAIARGAASAAVSRMGRVQQKTLAF